MALASAHLVELFLAARIYLLWVNLVIGVMGPIKCNPHIKKGDNGTMECNRALMVLRKFANFLHEWHCLCKSNTSWYIVFHVYPMRNIFWIVELGLKRLPMMTACRFRMTSCALMADRYHLILSYTPYLSRTSWTRVKGKAILTKLFLCEPI